MNRIIKMFLIASFVITTVVTKSQSEHSFNFPINQQLEKVFLFNAASIQQNNFMSKTSLSQDISIGKCARATIFYGINNTIYNWVDAADHIKKTAQVLYCSLSDVA